MGKGGKVVVFVFVCLMILVVLVLVKEGGGGSVMWLGALAIPLIYKSMFGKKNDDKEDPNQEITLKK